MDYKPLKSRKNRRFSIVVTVSFLIFITWIFLAADKMFALYTGILSIPVIFLMVFETSKTGWRYRVDNEGVVINRTFRKYHIYFSDIDSVREISRSQAGKLVNKAGNSGSKSGSDLNKRINLGRLIGYCSVPVAGSSVKDIYESSNGAIVYNDRFVLLSRTNGKQYILSPADSSGFVRECKSIMSEIR